MKTYNLQIICILWIGLCLGACEKDSPKTPIPTTPVPKPWYESRDFSKDGTVAVLQQATRGKGIDLILMGDGFVDTDINGSDRYEVMMKTVMEECFAIEPTKSYREYFNVFMVYVVSKYPAGDTRFPPTIDGDQNKALTYASKLQSVQDYDFRRTVVVVLNPLLNGGVCYIHLVSGSVAFTGINATLHEAIGHGLGRLADEYSNVPSIAVSQNLEEDVRWRHFTHNMYLNISISDDLEELPWKHFIGQPGYEMVGCYEGGYYRTKGVWRPEENSIMRSALFRHFNAPSRELIVKRIKQLAGEPYNWEEFLENDKPALPIPSASSRSFFQDNPNIVHHPPIIHFEN